MPVQKQLNSNLELNRKRKENLTKMWKINIEKAIETLRGDMSILSEIEKNIQNQEKPGRL